MVVFKASPKGIVSNAQKIFGPQPRPTIMANGNNMGRMRARNPGRLNIAPIKQSANKPYEYLVNIPKPRTKPISRHEQ